MLLSDKDITLAAISGGIIIEPWRPELLQPASLDVTLDSRFLVFPPGPAYVDPSLEPPEGDATLVTVMDGESFVLRPYQFVLASTVEWVGLSAGFAARVEGKSGLGRLGLMAHVTAGFIDPGFKGSITLELVNVSSRPLRLWPGMAIAQLSFMPMSSPVQRLYGSRTGARYMQQDGPTRSRTWVRWRVWPVREPGRDGVVGGPDVGGEVGPAAAVKPEPWQQGYTRARGMWAGGPAADVGGRPPH